MDSWLTNAQMQMHTSMAHTLTDLAAPRGYHAPRSQPGQSDFSTRGSPTDSVLLAFSFSLEMAGILIPFSYTLLLPFSNIFFSHWSKEKKGGPRGKESTHHWRRSKRCGFNPWVRKMPWRRAWQPTAVFAWRLSWREEPGGLQSTGSQSQTQLKRLSLRKKSEPEPSGPSWYPQAPSLMESVSRTSLHAHCDGRVTLLGTGLQS